MVCTNRLNMASCKTILQLYIIAVLVKVHNPLDMHGGHAVYSGLVFGLRWRTHGMDADWQAILTAESRPVERGVLGVAAHLS